MSQKHEHEWDFDRLVCACGRMHFVCDCGASDPCDPVEESNLHDPNVPVDPRCGTEGIIGCICSLLAHAREESRSEERRNTLNEMKTLPAWWKVPVSSRHGSSDLVLRSSVVQVLKENK